jgi:hypothetical protein
MANKQYRLPPPLRYTPMELAEEWGVSATYIWQQIGAGKLKAQARDSAGKWHDVTPRMGEELDFGSRGLKECVTVIDKNARVAPSTKQFHWSRDHVRVTHKAREEFEQLAIQEDARPERRDEKEKPLETRERTTLLTIIAALCKELEIDWSSPSKAAGSIENMTQQLGARVAPRTIEGHLKRIPEALQRRSK